ncbi:MAG TPA: protein kinase [Kofleriaceae bacterium]|nr:protein kinase [Kofleriaceae bacterium]
MEHLDDNAASEFVSGTLAPSALGKVEGHLAGCRECRALVAALAAGSAEDSSVATYRHELLSASQAGELPRRTLSVGDRVGRYLVLSSLGAGGMGVVFAAFDPQLNRRIALKLLRSGLSSKDARSRLRREAQAIAQLSHPNVVSVYDVGTTDDGDLYIAMEFVEGDTLTTWLKKYPRTWREIIDVFLQAARGLVAAHGVGLLHRDFKPDNVLVGGDGRVRVTDFGLARSVLSPDEVPQTKPEMTALNLVLTATGTVLGTPRYMPPEQMTGLDLDARSDQFSFCVALYEALYGRHPLRDGTSVLMLEHGDRALPPPEGLKVPAAIGRAVLRGLERDRAKRFPSMGSLIAELVPSPQRSPVRYAGFAAAALVLVGGTAFVAQQQLAPSPPPVDGPAMKILNDEKAQKEHDRERLQAQLDEVERASKVDHDEIERLTRELNAKDDEIQRLTETVTQLRANTKLIEAQKRSARPSTEAQLAVLTGALAMAQAPVEGCFREWSERTRATDATFVVSLSVTPDGIGSMPRIERTPDAHPITESGVSGTSALEFCVSERITGVRFPPGNELLDLAVTARWSPGQVTLTPVITGRHAVPQRQIELP